MRRISPILVLLAILLALPACGAGGAPSTAAEAGLPWWSERTFYEDRKSTRLNSSHT